MLRSPSPLSPPWLSFKLTKLSTDASWQGLGYVLQQLHGGTWSLVEAGSRFLSDSVSRYTIIELELLAVAWTATKCKIFLAGLQHFSVVTGHNPLIPILNNQRLDEIKNPWLQRLKSRLMAYNFTTQWIKGKGNNAPDACYVTQFQTLNGMTPFVNMTANTTQSPQLQRSEFVNVINTTGISCITYVKNPPSTQSTNSCTTQ